MPFTLTVESFLACLRDSGLIEAARLGDLLWSLREQGVDVGDPRAIADGLVQDGTLTQWQAENLLRGRRRGFVLGKYRLLSLLGRGGANAVYLAEHSLMRRRCAIKVLPAKNMREAAVERFLQEAQAVAQLDHTNIVRAYDVGIGLDGNVEIHYFAMEFVEGESLEALVARRGPLSAVDGANFIRQAAEGLAHAHAAGIVHRDIKPANLLVDRDGVVKILDLGLATLFGSEPSSHLTDGQPIHGTIDYLPPEQALDVKSADARSDIYSLGCTFYYLLAGHVPFPEGTLTERLVCHQTKRPVPMSAIRSDVPADLSAILERMLAKKPADRLQTADELSLLLSQWLVRHADPQWLRRNPSLLARSESPMEGTGRSPLKGAPLKQPAAAANLPATESQPRPKQLTASTSTDFEFFDPNDLSAVRSIIDRNQRSQSTGWNWFRRLWQPRTPKTR